VVKAGLKALFLFIILFKSLHLSANAFIIVDEDTIVLKKDKSKGLIPLPLLYYTPDTRLAYGAMAVKYFKLRSSAADTVTRLSYTKLLIDYTQNKQLDIWASWNIFTSGEKYIIKGEARYRNFPDRFYGVGNRTLLDANEFYSYDLVTMKILGLRKIGDRIFAGIDYQITNFYNVRKEPNGQLIKGNIPGSFGGLNSGVGLVYTIDRRDNVFNSHKGMFLELSSYFYQKFLGSDFIFNNYNVIYNKYFPLKDKHTLAVQFVGNFNTGHTPFYNLSPAGGDEILRGYAKNRYRDLNFMGTQAEYRFPIWWRLGGVTFAGLGDVFDSFKDMNYKYLKFSYGVGLRLNLNKKENVNIRVDYGFGLDSQGFYLSIGEAF
jgi:hypothetical protein